MVGLTTRAARPADNAALLSLFRECPMTADISLVVDRSPDFFALSRARGDAATLVVEKDGAVFGCASSWRRKGWLASTPTEFGYVGDLRIHPDHRRRGGGRGLAHAVLDQISQLPLSLYLVTIASGNGAIGALVTRLAEGRPKLLSRFTSWQLLPIWRFAPPGGLQIDAAEERDEDELADLLDESHRSKNLAPVFSDGGLRSLIQCSPGMAMSDYLIARRRGRMVAALGVWDARAVKATRVLGMPFALRGMFAMGRALSRLAPLPPFPAPGAMLRFRYIRHPAYRDGEQDALSGLVRHALNSARSRRDHFLLFTCADDDPLRGSIEGIPRSSYHYGLWGGSNRPGQSVPIPQGRFFDDAALA
jgi:hypothetical protein